MPAATDLAPSRTMAWASTVAVVVPSPAMSLVLRGDFAHHLRAHVLELVLELDFLGDGDAVLGDARGAEALVEHDVAALGAERHLHRVGENVDAAQHAVAGVAGEFDVLGSHFSLLLELLLILILRSAKAPSRRMRPGIVVPSSFETRAPARSSGRGIAIDLGDDAHDVALLHDQEFLAVDLDLGARPLAEQDAVAGLDVDRDELAGLVAAAGADGDDFALLRLFLGGVGDDDAARGLLFGIDARTTTRSCRGRNFVLAIFGPRGALFLRHVPAGPLGRRAVSTLE